MPKSKRNKVVALTATQKKGNVLKQGLVEEIRKCVDEYAYIYVFSVRNMRNTKLKDIRTEWRHSRFFMGKNKVMAVALGRTAEDEVQQDLHKISKKLVGNVGLLFTNRSKQEVTDWFHEHVESDYARSGSRATVDFLVPEGPLDQFPHSMEVQLRSLGLPTSLKKGVIEVDREYAVCREGDTLNPQQAQLLKLFGVQMVQFKVVLEACWAREGGYEEYEVEEEDGAGGDESMDE
eukprot:comp16763_c0_seq1/m.15110 comp16763_c0_seq1/g.15110  ORF comp16763_c0_seq1/g.15110 comp16763_c0_seq1/m.15110 type:complete len:234 (-) comp16763_c0_seq1:3-704(-)